MCLNKKSAFAITLMFLSNTLLASNPASQQYVNERISESTSYLLSQIANIPVGATGATGATGPVGPTGPAGPGVAVGGGIGQFLVKASATDYDTQWINGPHFYTVGEQALGGIVFWVDSSGEHGLVSAKADNTTGRWGTALQTLANADGIYAGTVNNTISIAIQAAAADVAPSAVTRCAVYSVEADGTTPCPVPGSAGNACYGDWYLPAKFELYQLYLQQNIVGGFFLALPYWSSTENTAVINEAWTQNFSTGAETSSRKTNMRQVRCIRKF